MQEPDLIREVEMAELIGTAVAVVVALPASLVVLYILVRVVTLAFFNSKHDFVRKMK